MTDLDELERKARAATPGNWSVKPMKGYTDDYVITDHPEYQTAPHGNLVAECGLAAGHKRQNFQNDAAFIAAANPAVILALIERVRANEATRQEYRDEMASQVRVATEDAWREAVIAAREAERLLPRDTKESLHAFGAKLVRRSIEKAAKGFGVRFAEVEAEQP